MLGPGASIGAGPGPVGDPDPHRFGRRQRGRVGYESADERHEPIAARHGVAELAIARDQPVLELRRAQIVHNLAPVGPDLPIVAIIDPPNDTHHAGDAAEDVRLCLTVLVVQIAAGIGGTDFLGTRRYFRCYRTRFHLGFRSQPGISLLTRVEIHDVLLPIRHAGRKNGRFIRP